jgi:P pilus assembly chaperone PapD
MGGKCRWSARRPVCHHSSAVCHAGQKENTLRIIDATNNQLPQDRESLFWMNVKAIPSMDKSKLSDNTLQLAIISRIKLYYRPENWPCLRIRRRKS